MYRACCLPLNILAQTQVALSFSSSEIICSTQGNPPSPIWAIEPADHMYCTVSRTSSHTDTFHDHSYFYCKT